MNKFLTVLVLVFLIGCGESTEPSQGFLMEQAALAPPPKPKPAISQLEETAASERKLIWTVDLNLSAEDTENIAQQIRDLGVSRGGYVASFNARRQQELFSYQITLRVPVDQREEMLSEIKGLAVRVDHESVQSEDVTERYIDRKARLQTLEATETELRALLSESRQRSQKAEDIMAIYRELTDVRSKIEQVQGKLNVLQNLTALATIKVQLRPTESARPVVRKEWQASETVHKSIRTLVFTLQRLVDLAIVLVIVLLPVAVIVGVAMWALIKLLGYLAKRRKARQGV